MDISKKSICNKIIKPAVTGNQNWDRVTVVMNNFYSDPNTVDPNTVQLGHTLDQCNNNDCYTVGFNGGFTVTGKMSFAAMSCLVTYGSPEVCGGVEIIPGALVIGFTAGLNYNQSACDDRWIGNVCVGTVKAYYDIGFNIPTRVNYHQEYTLYTGKCL